MENCQQCQGVCLQLGCCHFLSYERAGHRGEEWGFWFLILVWFGDLLVYVCVCVAYVFESRVGCHRPRMPSWRLSPLFSASLLSMNAKASQNSKKVCTKGDKTNPTRGSVENREYEGKS